MFHWLDIQCYSLSYLTLDTYQAGMISTVSEDRCFGRGRLNVLGKSTDGLSARWVKNLIAELKIRSIECNLLFLFKGLQKHRQKYILIWSCYSLSYLTLDTYQAGMISTVSEDRCFGRGRLNVLNWPKTPKY
jgi:hypothetical protein